MRQRRKRSKTTSFCEAGTAPFDAHRQTMDASATDHGGLFIACDCTLKIGFDEATLRFSSSLSSLCDFGTASLAAPHAFFS